MTGVVALYTQAVDCALCSTIAETLPAGCRIMSNDGLVVHLDLLCVCVYVCVSKRKERTKLHER